MDGISNIYFPASALLIIILLIILFFSKKRVNNIETRIYKWLIIINLLESIFACSIVSFALINGSILVLNILDKIDYILILSWIWLLFLYAYMLAFKNKKIIMITGIINIIIYILILFTNIVIINENGVMNSYGISYNILFTSVIAYLLLTIIFVFIGIYKNVSKKKYAPIASLLLLIVTMILIRIIKPELVLLSFIMSFITLIMYHTIENPDVKMINELELAKIQAEKANRAKTDFLSSMSHEIRTPLNAIVGLSEVIKNSDDLNEIHEDAKDVIIASNNLLEIVNGILDIGKIEANKVELEESEYRPIELFKNLSMLAKMKISEKEKRLDFKCKFDENLPDVLYGDCVKVQQIILNLLTNAIKYTENGYVEFNVKCVNEKDKCKLKIDVSDTGRGIKNTQMDNLFTKFNRLEEDMNTTIEGTGLGLAITKSLVELMGGKILVQSTYGKGSTFTVFLSQKISNSNKLLNEENEVQKNKDYKGRKVLVVDDNNLNIKVATKILKKFNLDIESVNSGRECIDKIINNERYDIIFMDIMMPEMSGVETLKKLRQIENFNTPIIALTADAIKGNSNKYIEVGFNNYLSKPIKEAELIRIMEELLNNNNEENKHKVIITTDEDIKKFDKKLADMNEKSMNDKFKNSIDYLKENDIDVDASLELLGDIETYNNTLKTFIEEAKTRILRMEKNKKDKNMKAYTIDVHTMKSDSKYLGFKKLAELSYNHEIKSKENNIDYVIQHYDELLNEYNKIINIVYKYLGI